MEMQGAGPMLNHENFLQNWCATLGENRWLTLESVIEFVNARESKLREELQAAPAQTASADCTSVDEILVGDTVYVRAGGFREHKATGRNLRVYIEEGNPLTQVAELKADTTPALIAELDWCIEEGQSGPRTRAALNAARKVLAVPTATAVVETSRDVEAYRKRAHAAECGCYRAGLVVDQASGEWAPPAAFGEQQPGALYQLGKEVRGEVTWADVDYTRYARTLNERANAGQREVFGFRPKIHLRIVFQNPPHQSLAAPAAGVFAQGNCLQRWAEADEFWGEQMYGNRFYFGSGGLDYVPRDVLRAFVNQLGLDATGPTSVN
jgi:hypothetical protein